MDNLYVNEKSPSTQRPQRQGQAKIEDLNLFSGDEGRTIDPQPAESQIYGDDSKENIIKINDQDQEKLALEKYQNSLDPKLVQLAQEEKYKKIYKMKIQSALVFYDYIVDQNHQLATLFLKDPFINTDLIEKKDKAVKYWNFFSKKQVNKDISLLAENNVVEKKKRKDETSSSSSSSSDTDSDSGLSDKEEIQKGARPQLLGKSYERDKTWTEMLKDIDEETVQQIREDIQLFLLQAQDDEMNNCLHFSCKKADKVTFDLIIEMSNKLTEVYKNRQLSETLEKFQKIYKIEKVKDGTNIGKDMNVLRALMRTPNNQLRIPFFNLCHRDLSLELFREDPRTRQIKTTFIQMISKMVECEKEFSKEASQKVDNFLTFNFFNPITHYSCLHWLAYNDDSVSIDMILKQIEERYSDDHKKLDEYCMRVMTLTKSVKSSSGAGRMTPITIAGERGNKESLKAFLSFFKRNQHVILEIFDGDLSFKPIPEKIDQLQKVKLKVFSKNQLKNEDQVKLTELFYWATIVNDIEIINLFLVGLGFSPFMNIFKGQTPVHATCLMTDDMYQQDRSFELYEYLVKNCSKGLKQIHKTKYTKETIQPHDFDWTGNAKTRLLTQPEDEDLNDNRYEFLNAKDQDTFESSRQTCDSQGNSIMHYIFGIELGTTTLRNKFLKMAIEEHIGDTKHRNVENYLPFQIQHRQPIDDIPDNLLHYFPTTIQEVAEADYLIVTKKKDQKFISEQLGQMKLLKHTRYYYIQQTIPNYSSPQDKIKNWDFGSKKVDISLISIRIPPRMIENFATKDKRKAGLTNNESGLTVVMPFQKENIGDFNMFEARHRFEIIEHLLGDQIDFNLMKLQGIVLDHYPLHKRSGPSSVIELYRQHQFGLMIGFLTGNFYKHMYPLNFLKCYYGEKYALQVAFLLHYQAWLVPPTIFGVITVIFNLFHYQEHKEELTDANDVVDNFGNAAYGLLISIWASLMIESWRNTEQIIAFEWGVDKDNSKRDDERTQEFKFNWVFNDTSNVQEKDGLKHSSREMCLSRFGQFVSVILTVTVMIIYISLDGILTSTLKTFQQEVEVDPSKYTKFEQDSKFTELGIYANINSFVYSFALICLNMTNGKLSEQINDKENHRYQSKYEDSMIQKLFIMGFFNFYFPMFLVAFLKYFNYNDLLSLVVTQLGLKQVALNVLEYYVPVFFTSTKMKKLEETFQDVIDIDLKQYEDVLNKSLHGVLDATAKIGEEAEKINSVMVKAVPIHSILPIDSQKSSQEQVLDQQNSFDEGSEQINDGKKGGKQDMKRQNQLTEEEKLPIELGGGVWYFQDKYKELHNSRFRYYQALRDYCMYSEKPKIIMLYQEVVAQFGFVTLFGQIFPLGAMFSMLANYVQIKIQIGHLRITRRWKPEITITIGNWLTMMQFLSTLSVVTNSAMIYFTHQKITTYFLGESPHPDNTGEENGADILTDSDTLSWEIIQFFLLVVAVEHIIILIKNIIQFRADVPEFIHQGLKDREAIKKEYKLGLTLKAKRKKQVSKEMKEKLAVKLENNLNLNLKAKAKKANQDKFKLTGKRGLKETIKQPDNEGGETDDDLLVEAQRFSEQKGY